MVKKYFGNSYRRVVSSLIEEEDLSIEDLKEIIKDIEKNRKPKK
jgi:hypothetical protein